MPTHQTTFPAELHAHANQQEVRRQNTCAAIRTIHTLGPAGTNLCAASWLWFARHGIKGAVVLHRTVEDAISAMPVQTSDALMTCAVYPDLHHVVFANLSRFEFVDAFIFPTFPMILASRDGERPRSVATHPAPQGLVPASADRVLTTSNAQAARDCADGRTEGCITTLAALNSAGLTVVQDFGPVPMVYTLHGQPFGEQPDTEAKSTGR